MIGYMFLGIALYIGFKWFRAVTSGQWDTSNVLNLLRYESYHAMYPGNHANMYVLEEKHLDALHQAGFEDLIRPYRYVTGDEFSDHFPYTRFDKK